MSSDQPDSMADRSSLSSAELTDSPHNMQARMVLVTASAESSGRDRCRGWFTVDNQEFHFLAPA